MTQKTLIVEEAKIVEDGKHKGKIVGVEFREQPFKYTDIIVELENGVKLKAGYPTMLTMESRLGRLLLDFGATIQVGESVDLEEVLLNKPCSLLTMTEVTERGKFAKIVAGSLKPVK